MPPTGGRGGSASRGGGRSSVSGDKGCGACWAVAPAMGRRSSRYNWYDYAIENVHEPMNLMMNPDVTVRSQGVMEKCTFCVQRIQNSRQIAKDEGRPIADGEVTPACAQSCPASAIVFGNLKDKKSEAVKRADAGAARSYYALHELNTRPSINYLAKVTRSTEG